MYLRGFFCNNKIELNAWITSLLAFADSERGEPLCDDELKIFGQLLTPKASIKGIRDLIECFHEEDKFYWVVDVLSSCDVEAQGAILLFLSIVLFGKGYFTDKDKLFIAKLVFLKKDNN